MANRNIIFEIDLQISSAEFRSRTDSSPRTSIGKSNGVYVPTPSSGSSTAAAKPAAKVPVAGNFTTWKKQCLATFMDVAVLRCIFIPHWDEEGVIWGLTFILKRLEEVAALKELIAKEKSLVQRPRSHSLPAPKPNKTAYLAQLVSSIEKQNAGKVKLKPSLSAKSNRGKGAPPQQFVSQSACSSPTVERRATSRRGSEKGSKKKLTMFDLRAFVETKLLSKSDKMIDKSGEAAQVSTLIEHFFFTNFARFGSSRRLKLKLMILHGHIRHLTVEK